MDKIVNSVCKKLGIKWFYKGHKVYKFYRYALSNYILFVSTVPSIIFLIRNFFIMGKSRFKEHTIAYLFSDVGTGLIISVLILLLSIKFMIFLYNMQKLCQMAFNSVFYNLEGKEIDGEIISSPQIMTYFPAIYYRVSREHKNNREITVKLDGSRYERRFLTLDDSLTNMFSMDVIGRNRQYWYIKYTLSDVSKHRLNIKDVDFSKLEYKIPITKSLFWDIIKTPHALITGTTGGGKTYFILYIFRALLAMGAEINIIDPKRADLYSFRKYLGKKVASEAGEVLPMLRSIDSMMTFRYEDMIARKDYKVGANFADYSMKPIFLIFDEFMAFVDSLDKSDKDHTMNFLRQIALKGRQAGVFLILATQRADASYLSGALRDVLGMRVSLGSLEKEGYRMTFGTVEKTLERREKQHGYVHLDGVTNTIRDFSAPFIPPDYDLIGDIEQLLA